MLIRHNFFSKPEGVVNFLSGDSWGFCKVSKYSPKHELVHFIYGAAGKTVSNWNQLQNAEWKLTKICALQEHSQSFCLSQTVLLHCHLPKVVWLFKFKFWRRKKKSGFEASCSRTRLLTETRLRQMDLNPIQKKWWNNLIRVLDVLGPFQGFCDAEILHISVVHTAGWYKYG